MIHKEIIHKTLTKIPGVSEEVAHMTTESLVYANDINIKEAIKNMATKDDIKDMATKADIKDMATKADIKDIESRMATKRDIDGLRVEIAELETRMVKQQMINAGVIIASISFIMLLMEFFT